MIGISGPQRLHSLKHEAETNACRKVAWRLHLGKVFADLTYQLVREAG